MQSSTGRNIVQGAATIEQGIERSGRLWWLFLLLGVLLIFCGVACIAYPFVSSVGAVLVLGALLIVSGAFTVVGAFYAGRWSSLLLQLLVGILYVMAGMAIRDTPIESTAVLTLFVAAFFVVVGSFRVIVSLLERFPLWGWALLNGVVTLLAGIIIYDTYPLSALWVIGLLVGLELLFNGWSWVMVSLAVRAVRDDRAPDAPQPENELVTVFESLDEIEAELVKMELATQGIPSVIDNSTQAGLAGCIPARVQVRSADAERAKDFIAGRDAPDSP